MSINSQNIELCACGRLNQLKCDGECRLVHTKTEGVVCTELYFREPSPKNTRRKKKVVLPLKDKNRAKQRRDKERKFDHNV